MTSALHRALTRRMVLALGLAAGATACTPSPVINRPAPSTTPEFEQARREAAQFEVDAGAAWRRFGEVVASSAEYAAAMTALHVAHATVLLQRDPFAGLAADPRPGVALIPAPVIANDEPTASTQVLHTTDRAAKKAETTMTARADVWDLLWASLAVSGQSTGRLVAERAPGASFGPAPAATEGLPRRIELAGAAQAALAAVEELVALHNALLAGIGLLPGNDPLRDRLDGMVIGVRFEIDRVREQHLKTEPSKPAELGVRPAQPLENSEAVARWVASHFLSAGDRLTKLAAVSKTVRLETLAQAAGHFTNAMQLGAAPVHWPGWA